MTADTEAPMVDSKELEEILTRGLHDQAHARVIAEAILVATADLEKRIGPKMGAVDDGIGDDEMDDSLFGTHIRKAFRTMRGSA